MGVTQLEFQWTRTAHLVFGFYPDIHCPNLVYTSLESFNPLLTLNLNLQALAFGYFPIELILHFAEILSTAPTSTIETLFVSNIDNHQVTIGQQEMSNIWNEDQLMNNVTKNFMRYNLIF